MSKKVTFTLIGNEGAVKSAVRSMLDKAGFSEVKFSVDENTTESAVPVVDPRRVALEEIRDNFKRREVLSLSDLKFLVILAVNDYDLSGSDVASNVEDMLLNDNGWKRYVPGPSIPREPRPPRPAPLGPMVRVDIYECVDDRLRVEVERVSGTDDIQVGARGAYLREELPALAPSCLTCEREMTLVERRLRRATR